MLHKSIPTLTEQKKKKRLNSTSQVWPARIKAQSQRILCHACLDWSPDSQVDSCLAGLAAANTNCSVVWHTEPARQKTSKASMFCRFSLLCCRFISIIMSFLIFFLSAIGGMERLWQHYGLVLGICAIYWHSKVKFAFYFRDNISLLIYFHSDILFRIKLQWSTLQQCQSAISDHKTWTMYLNVFSQGWF